MLRVIHEVPNTHLKLNLNLMDDTNEITSAREPQPNTHQTQLADYAIDDTFNTQGIK